jgi:hypothetical protein
MVVNIKKAIFILDDLISGQEANLPKNKKIRMDVI